MAKRCSVCSESNEEMFSKDRSSKDGLRCRCRACDKTARDRNNRKEYHRVWYKTNKKSIQAKQKIYYRANKKAFQRRLDKYRKANVELIRTQNRRRGLKRRYGIDEDTYREMFSAQNGLCFVCGKPETLIQKGRVRQLSVDHCHRTNVVRKLLCSACNTCIGQSGDDPNILRKMADYIEKFHVS